MTQPDENVRAFFERIKRDDIDGVIQSLNAGVDPAGKTGWGDFLPGGGFMAFGKVNAVMCAAISGSNHVLPIILDALRKKYASDPSTLLTLLNEFFDDDEGHQDRPEDIYKWHINWLMLPSTKDEYRRSIRLIGEAKDFARSQI